MISLVFTFLFSFQVGSELAHYREYQFANPGDADVKEVIRQVRVEQELPLPSSEAGFPHSRFSQASLDRAWVICWGIGWALAAAGIYLLSAKLGFLASPFLVIGLYLSPYVLFFQVDRWGVPEVGSFLSREKISAVVTADSANVHTTKDSSSHIVSVLSEAEEILIEESSEGWSLVDVEGGRVGWVEDKNLYKIGVGEWKQK